MIRSRHSARLLGLAGALCALFSPGLARAQVTITSNVTSSGPLFTYNFSVTNNAAADPTGLGLNDVAVVTFTGAVNGSSILNETAPAGFLITVGRVPGSPDDGLVSFLEDLNPGGPTFAPGTTISGFSFQSLLGPGTTNFEALNASGNTFTGPMTSAVGAAAVPEPGAWLTLSMGALGAGILIARRKRTQKETHA